MLFEARRVQNENTFPYSNNPGPHLISQQFSPSPLLFQEWFTWKFRLAPNSIIVKMRPVSWPHSNFPAGLKQSGFIFLNPISTHVAWQESSSMHVLYFFAFVGNCTQRTPDLSPSRFSYINMCSTEQWRLLLSSIHNSSLSST